MTHRIYKIAFYLNILLVLVVLSGYFYLQDNYVKITTLDRKPVPEALFTSKFNNIPNTRFWMDEWPAFDEDIMQTWSDEDFRKNEPALFEKKHNYLAISGGADKSSAHPMSMSSEIHF
jgi:hypothetical protein